MSNIKEVLIKNKIIYSGWLISKRIKTLIPINEIKRQNLKIGTYENLYHIKDNALYKKYLVLSQKIALNQMRKNKPIKVAFQTALLQTWIGDDILKLFNSDNRFDVTVVLTWQKNTEKERELLQLKEHFKGFDVKVRLADGTVKPKDFDIIFFTTPYIEALENFSWKSIPLNTLVCYIPYGFLLADIQKTQFNLFVHNIVWKNYVTAKDYVELSEKYCDIGSHGVVYSGYPKMDAVYQGKEEYSKWKKADNIGIKKIIYAPHHSIDAKPYYSTFAQNKDFILECAKKYADETSWIFKPHPLLGLSAVKSGLFRNEKEYLEYVDSWNSLPNATVVEGDYLSLMASSDAMIMDSVSFMCEYLYFHKPMLFLERNKGGVNEFGEKIKDVLYQVSGDDFDGIRDFIENTIDNDFMKTVRERVYEKELDYYTYNKMLAAEFIYSDICKGVFSDE